MGRSVRFRALPPQSGVEAVAVIILPPLLDEMPGFCQRPENILFQAFIPQPYVELSTKSLSVGFPG